MTSSAGLALAAGMIVATVAAASCSVGDQVCTDQTVEEDRDDDCPYGPPGGPQRKNAERCTVAFDDANCTKSFRDDVYPILISNYAGGRSGGGCTLAACHGDAGTGSIAIVLPETSTPDELYALLRGYTNDIGDPYLDANNEHAFMLCNVTAAIGGGSAMPPTSGLTDDPSTPEDDEDLATIQEWVRCGMQLDGSGEGGGGEGGGGGGAEGGGGAGGGP